MTPADVTTPSAERSTGHPQPPLRSALGDLLTSAAVSWPDAEAVVYTPQLDVREVRWTFGGLDREASDLGRGLIRAGYQPGEHIAVWGTNVPEWILLEWAAAKAGLTLVALNPLYKKRELVFALNVTETRGIFLVDKTKSSTPGEILNSVRSEVPSLRDIHSLTEDLARLAANGRAGAAELPTVTPDQIMMVQFTSGTTGVPKAAKLTHQSLATTGRDLLARLDVRPTDRIAHGFPLFHVGGSGVLTPAIAAIGCTTLPLVIFEAGRSLDLLEKERCTGFFGVPTMLIAMLEHPTFPSRDLSALQFVVVGGASMPLELVHRVESGFGVELVNVYGQTETSGVLSSAHRCDSAELKSQTVGRPLPGVTVKIVDPAGDTLSVGEAGELCYQGPGRMAGYINEASEEPPAVDATGWLHTGDRATLDADGYLRIVGRVKEMVIRGGENLAPAEIEEVLLEHPDIAEVAVVGVPDARYGEELCAVVRPMPGRTPAAADVRAWCGERLSRWKVPRYVEMTDALPLTPAGKVRKFLIQQEMTQRLGLAVPDP